MKNVSDTQCDVHVYVGVSLTLMVRISLQAYTGQLPSPETLKLRKESRSKILKAQGYYLPDPDARRFSPTLERIKYD